MDVKPNISVAAESIKRFPKLDNQELVKPSFWISQVFMIIATIVGVYLAAQEGLSQAIIFDDLSNKQDNYYLRHALFDEVNDNVTIINEYADTVAKSSPYDLKSIHPTMATFVWENMRYSANTLETPTQILTETRRFYMTSANIISKMESRFYGAKFGAEKLKELTKNVSESTLPMLQKNYQALAAELDAANITVE
ncbi:hypothetical protein CXF83_19500 [Shewanella sp. Choline-02u-19]|uniref:hypothetical protein n=1 Tax=unclassified Shewanella TaxID=196818 RepID=UPI000C34882F|nr:MULTISPECIES: hypothetical protein [unclassified Shewanella]PKG55948.1 hypothetical protein CXF82_17095 [Shewanella sp. GutDb-MelDb]PKG76565.1 hypothetical protein CXF86_00300 [Shewanella sp. GutCb]PKH56197.1 hypothetical protein CXF84_14245 [Shewanella sp. Bg11-22]PKI28733.1 hypothetical protein CXF83_19500 [Shewanella sp. Choline-02u-19]